MQVQDIMNKNVITIDGNTTVEDAAKLMVKENIGCLPVMMDGSLSGIITESDFIGKRVEVPHGIGSLPELLGEWFEGVSVESVLLEARKRPVSEVMERNLIFVNSNTSLTETVNIMMNNDVNRLPVIDGGKLSGIVSRRDVLTAFDKLGPNG